ncbi:DUF397 domain-containing protein [Actinoplanes sp. NPDC023801]|uniref:DUF397 domain-containing protein n=1 Tax=Actinoplanes sp. NPDC023801 TaxID=3154595 RepID=UPI0033DF82C3
MLSRFAMTWRKSTRSGDKGACVEVRRVDDTVEVRDTKDRTLPAQVFTLTEWERSLAGPRTASSTSDGVTR